MKKHRSIREQVKSGFRIAGLIVLALCFFVGLWGSLEYAIGQSSLDKNNDHRVLGMLAAATLIVTMYKTTQYWARWLIGILGLSFFRMVGALFMKGFFELPPNISFARLLAWSVYLLAAFVLTARHTKRAPEGIEKFGLLAFVVCVPLAMVSGSTTPLLYGLGILVIAELAQRFLSHRNRHVRPDLAAVSPPNP